MKNIKIYGKGNLEVTNKDTNKADNNRINQKFNYNSLDNTPILLQPNKNKKVNKKKKKDINIDRTDDELKENRMVCFYDTNEERPLGEGERVVQEWYFD